MLRTDYRTRMNEESGQALILIVGLITVVFIIGVIAVDFGLYLAERRDAQKAADLAALAAASKLHVSDPDTVARGLDFADRNGFDDADGNTTVVVTPQYDANPDLVEVTVSRDMPGVFGTILGIAGIDVGARAVAESTLTEGQGGEYAIFANRQGCGLDNELQISGSNGVTFGDVHSNGDASVSGSNNAFNGPFTFDCSLTDGGGGNTYDPPAEQTQVEPMPLYYEYADFPCDRTFNGDVDLSSVPTLWMNSNPGSNVLLSQVICATGNLSLSQAGASGNVTLVAGGKLTLNGSDFNLTGLWNDVLVFSCGYNSGNYVPGGPQFPTPQPPAPCKDVDPALDLSGSGGTWIGYFLAPYGRTTLQGQSNLTVSGSVIGDQVVISGSDFAINAFQDEEPEPGPPAIRLVE